MPSLQKLDYNESMEIIFFFIVKTLTAFSVAIILLLNLPLPGWD